MFGVYRSKDFDKSYKKLERSGRLTQSALTELDAVIALLEVGAPLPRKNRDHRLRGDLQQYRECHIKDDLLMIYQIYEDKMALVLVDIGTHEDFF
jgi:mRNA interferase YafQ